MQSTAVQSCKSTTCGYDYCLHASLTDIFLKNYFKLNKEVISRETRRSNFIYLPAVRTETAKKSFYYNGSVVYNNYLVNKN